MTDSEKAQTVIDTLKKHKKEKIIYPGTLREECNLDIEEIYKVLHVLSKKRLLSEILEPWCPQCKSATSIICETISEVPDEMICPHCGGRIQFPLKHALVVYQNCNNKENKDDRYDRNRPNSC